MTRYDDAWVKELADDARRRGGLVTSRFEDCKTVLDVLEVLDDIMWVLPKEKKASEPSKLTDKQMREAISLGVKLAEEEALFKLTMKAKQVAELDRRRPRLVIDSTKIEPRQA